MCALNLLLTVVATPTVRVSLRLKKGLRVSVILVMSKTTTHAHSKVYIIVHMYEIILCEACRKIVRMWKYVHVQYVTTPPSTFCLSVGIVHVYWIVSIVILFLFILLLGCVCLLRRKYIQNRYALDLCWHIWWLLCIVIPGIYVHSMPKQYTCAYSQASHLFMSVSM